MSDRLKSDVVEEYTEEIEDSLHHHMEHFWNSREENDLKLISNEDALAINTDAICKFAARALQGAQSQTPRTKQEWLKFCEHMYDTMEFYEAEDLVNTTEGKVGES